MYIATNKYNKDKMTAPILLKQIIFSFLCTLSALISVYIIFINITEAINRLLKKQTLLSQMSWLTDRQALLYSSLITLMFVVLLTLLGYKLYSNNKTGANIISVVTLIIALAILFFCTNLFSRDKGRFKGWRPDRSWL